MSWSQTSDRKFDNEIHNTPQNVGPGLYDISLTIGNHRQLKAPFGSRSRRDVFPVSKEDVPPPGSYDASFGESGVSISSVFHSNSKRGVYNIPETPDPTRYSLQHKWGEVSSPHKRYKCPVPESRPLTVFFGQKNVSRFKTNKDGEWVAVKVKERGPEEVGPGYYNPREAKEKKVPFSLNRHGDRSELFNGTRSQPGPAEYTPKITTKGKLLPKISSLHVKEKTPDDVSEFVNPYTWVTEDEKRQPTAVFKSKNKRETFSTSSSTPGPATYYRSATIPREYFDHSCFGVRAERKTMEVLNTVPGPGKYSVEDRSKSSIGIKIHPLIKDPHDIMSDIPGPGTYNESGSIKKTSSKQTPVFKCKVPRDIDPSTDTPGPGRYNPIINDRSCAVPPSIKEGPRDDSWVNKSQMENPDPTAYQHVIIEPRGGITISNINRKEEVNTNPGPGYYDVMHSSMLHRSYNSAVPDLTKF